jgi:hypothetical protein
MKIVGGMVFLMPEPKQLLALGAFALAAGVFLFLAYFNTFSSLSDAVAILQPSVILFGMFVAIAITHRIYEVLYPLSFHEFRIRPKSLVINEGRITGVETYDELRCVSCGKSFKEVRAEEDDFINILNWPMLCIVGDGRGDVVDRVDDLAKILSIHGIGLVQEETPLLYRFYTLEYDRGRRAVVVYRPPKEFESLIEISESAVQIVDYRYRGDENIIVMLIAFKIRFRLDNCVVSTCLLGIMKNGHVWLHQTLHTLPPSLDHHLAWSMGLSPDGSVVEADRGGKVWRPKLS